MADTLTHQEAYLAMYSFLEELYLKYGFDQFGGLLGGMSFLPDGATADPAAWQDWLRSVEKVKAGKVDGKLRF